MRDLGAEAMTHLEQLCVRIGPRPIGSRGNQAAAEYIAGVFEASGLQVAEQEIPCPAWDHGKTRLELAGHTLDAAANTFSPPCDLCAPTVVMGTLAELEAADLTGRIGVLYGDLTKGTGLSTRNGIHYPEHDRQIMETLERKAPLAVVTVRSTAQSTVRLIRDWEFPIPSVSVPPETGLTLLQQSDRQLSLRIESQRSAGRFRNVTACAAGDGGERIVLCAHFDTMTDTPGAIDNGSGVAIMLTLAEALVERAFPLGLEYLALNGEESGGLGDAAYLRQKGDTLAGMLAVINVDGVGGRVAANSITMLGESPAFRDQVAELHKGYPGVVWVDPWYASDHTAYFSRGVPCIAFNFVGVAELCHGPGDTVEWISPRKLGEVASLTADIVEGLQNRSAAWCRGEGS
jgi:Iap family predicted aminopeptidase